MHELAALLLGSFLNGYVKNKVVKDHSGPMHMLPHDSDFFMRSVVMFPLYEEAVFRQIPSMAPGPPISQNHISFAFGALHGLQEIMRGTPQRALFVTADAALGSVMYSAAFNRGGFLAAAAAHALHNMGMYTAWHGGPR